MQAPYSAKPVTLSIAAVERDTGLSKDTLRVWERRYGFPVPERDVLGERSYPFDQVERLRTIKRLLDAGGAMAREAGLDCAVGGNIGEAMLAQLGAIRPETTVILEISHTQLQYTDRSPHIAAVTNVTPNHLDQFSWDEYVGLKRPILAFQQRGDVVILNADDHTSRALMAAVKGKLVRSSIQREPDGDGAWVEDGEILVRSGSRPTPVVNVREIRLRGEHNLANVTMACAIGAQAGSPRDAMARAIGSFTGVAHRLEVVGRASGATWVNDSIFAPTSQIIVTLGMGAFMFTCITLIAIVKKGPIGFFKHFIPEGLPLFIVPLVFLIELVSYLSRPFSLGIRLAANMTAGHTLIHVIATFVMQLAALAWLLGALPVVFLIFMMGLESFVAILQAYVFTMLCCMYLGEALSDHH